MVKIFLTGFGAFHGVPHNPCIDIVNHLKEKVFWSKIVDCSVEDTNQVLDELYSLVEDEPTLIIHLGVAVGRKAITIETKGKNICDF